MPISLVLAQQMIREAVRPPVKTERTSPPRVLAAGLSAEDIAARRHFLGSSDARCIADGGPADLRQLWAEKTGRARPPDLSDKLPVLIGTVTEELNRYWFEQRTGRTVTRERERITHPDYPWLAATLDGITTTASGEGALFEAKHVNPFTYRADKVLSRYLPQLYHGMYVAGVHYAVLSVFVGTLKYEAIWTEFDPLYWAELFAAERRFWRYVIEDVSP